jgi:hypothetical protein
MRIPGRRVFAMVCGLGLFGIVLAVLLALLLGKLSSDVPPPLKSPGGMREVAFTATESRGDPATHKRIAIEIRRSGGGTEYRRQTRAHNLRSWSAKWEGDNRLILTSDEIGTLRWSFDGAAWHDDEGNAKNVVPPVPPVPPVPSAKPSTPPARP